MKILMTADTVGGIWTYAMELARSLARADVQIALATMGEPLNSEQRQQISELPHTILFESEFKLEWMDNPWPEVQSAGEWLLQIERDVRPDVIHLNGYAHGALPWRAPAVVVGHSCVLSWWNAVKGEAAPPAWNHYHDAVERGLAAVRHCEVGVSSRVQEDAEELKLPHISGEHQR